MTVIAWVFLPFAVYGIKTVLIRIEKLLIEIRDLQKPKEVKGTGIYEDLTIKENER